MNRHSAPETVHDNSSKSLGHIGVLALVLMAAAHFALAAYKPRPWVPRPRTAYAATETSQGITIAVDPLYQDALAAQVFDKTDVVSRGIMPLGIVVFNDNDFPVQIDGDSIEWLQQDERARTLEPEQFLPMLFSRKSKGVSLPVPIPRSSGSEAYPVEARDDFEHKFLAEKTIEAHQSGGGFLYFRIPQNITWVSQLAGSSVYIPEIHRQDTGAEMIFFEIDLKPAVESPRAK
jgi:hypothetical protein